MRASVDIIAKEDHRITKATCASPFLRNPIQDFYQKIRPSVNVADSVDAATIRKPRLWQINSRRASSFEQSGQNGSMLRLA